MSNSILNSFKNLSQAEQVKLLSQLTNIANEKKPEKKKLVLKKKQEQPQIVKKPKLKLKEKKVIFESEKPKLNYKIIKKIPRKDEDFKVLKTIYLKKDKDGKYVAYHDFVKTIKTFKFNNKKYTQTSYNHDDLYRQLRLWASTQAKSLLDFGKNPSTYEIFRKKLQLEGYYFKKQSVMSKTKIQYMNQDSYFDREIHNIMEIPQDIDQETLTAYIGSWLQTQQQQYETTISFESKVLTKADSLEDVKLKGVRLHYRILDNINQKEIKHAHGLCVPQYIFQELKTMKGYERLTYETVIDQFEAITHRNISDCEGVSLNEIHRFVKMFHKNVSVYCFNPMSKLILEHKPDKVKFKGTLAFVINNAHLYPITSMDEKMSIAKSKKLDLNCDVQKHFIDFVDDNFTFIDIDYEEFIKGNYHTDEKVILLNTDEFGDVLTMEKILQEMIKTLNCVDIPFSLDNQNRVDMLQHPDTKQILARCDNFSNRKMLYGEMYKKFPVEHFKFTNKSETHLVVKLFQTLVGHFPKSSYNEKALHYLDHFPPRPMVQTLTNQEIRKRIYGIDVTKCYSNSLLTCDHIPIYSIHSEIKEYKGENITYGEYYIEDVVLPFGYSSKKPVRIQNGFYSYSLINYLLENNFMTKSHIKSFITAFDVLDKECFHYFVKFVYRNFEVKDAKNLINFLIGDYNCKKQRRTLACITDDFETLVGLIRNSEDNKIKYTFNTLNGIFLFRETHTKRLTSDNCSIWRYVISSGIQQVINIMCQLPSDAKIVGVNTDCVFYTGSYMEFDETDEIGSIRRDTKGRPKKYKPFTQNYFKDFPFESKVGKGSINTGAGGCGKTELLINQVNKCLKSNESVIVLCPTNKSNNNINERYKAKFEDVQVSYVIDSYLTEQFSFEQKVERLANKKIYIDEFSMVSPKWWVIFYNAFIKYNTEFHIFGDCNQIEPVKAKFIDLTKSYAIRQMCPTVNRLKYISATGRYTQKLFDILDEFLTTGKLNYKFKTINSSLRRSICYTNATRKDILKNICQEGQPVNFVVHEDGMRRFETYKVSAGTPVIGTVNKKELNIFNSEEYVIQKVEPSKITLTNGVHLSPSEFGHYFLPSFCITTHKYQGATIKDDYNIYDASKMTRNLLYTALSRATHEDLIHIDTTKSYYPPLPENEIEVLKPIDGGIYKHSKIYEIAFPDGKKYIGYTTKTIKERFEEHMTVKEHKRQTQATKYYLETAVKPTIKLVARLPCFERKQIENYEAMYIQHFKKLYGDMLLNQKKTKGDKKEKQTEKKETKINFNITTDIKEKRFEIKESSDSFFIRETINGKKLVKKVRFGKTQTKGQALEKITEVQQELKCKYAFRFD